VPIDTKNEVRFVSLDVDIYDAREKSRFDTIIRAIEKHNAPIGIFNTKSGGFHFHIFFDRPVLAKEGLEVLRAYADLFGIKKTASTYQKQPLEFFPKQEILYEGKVGNWINLPYYDNGSLGQKMLFDGKHLTLEDAIQRIKTDTRKSLDYHKNYIAGVDLYDAPPCLQTISLLGDPPGGRNNFLFSMGVYLMRKNEDTFEASLYKENRKLTEPLPEKELDTTIISSLRRNEYSYKCKESPCQNFCDKRECSKREFGIGEGGEISNLQLGQIYKIVSGVDSTYSWEIEGKEIQFDSEKSIIDQGRFQEILMRELQIIPLKLKPNTWFKAVNKCLANLEIRQKAISEIEGASSELYATLGKYLEMKSSDRSKSAIVEGLAYRDKKEKSFYIAYKHFKAFAIKYGLPRLEIPSSFGAIAASLSGEPSKINVNLPNGSKTTKYVYRVPFDSVLEIMDVDPYTMDEDVIIRKRAMEVADERMQDIGSDEESMY
jgi:hypothetical protein